MPIKNYSDKTGHTNNTKLLFRCETMGLTEVKAGTTSSDAECEKVTSVGLIAGVITAVLIAVIVALLACIIYRKHKAWGSNERKN